MYLYFVTFANNLLPILLIASMGFLLSRSMVIEPRTVGRVVFYLLMPAFIFDLLNKNRLPLVDVFNMLGFALLATLIVGALTYIAGRLLKLPRKKLMAVLMTTMFINAGNYGIPLITLAFGADAAAYAALYFVASSILVNTLGVMIASMGTLSIGQALKGLIKVPTVYAVALAMTLNYLHLEIPTPLIRPIEMMGAGAVPVMLILLGMEISRVKLNGQMQILGLAAGMRLIIGPLVGMLLSALFGLEGAARQASIMQSSMPAAVVSAILATEYQLEPEFVTAVIFVSTLLSPLSLTPLLVFLGS